MSVRQKKQCEICGTNVFKLAKHIRTKHPRTTEDEKERMIIKQRSSKAIDQVRTLSYYRCPAILNFKKCGSIIKENG